MASFHWSHPNKKQSIFGTDSTKSIELFWNEWTKSHTQNFESEQLFPTAHTTELQIQINTSTPTTNKSLHKHKTKYIIEYSDDYVLWKQ